MRRNPEVQPWLWWVLGGAVLVLIATYGKSVAQMVKEQLSKQERIKKIQALAAERGIPEAVALAIFTVESGGKGFGSDGRMVIRFEPHIFRKYSGGKDVAVLRAGQKAEWDNYARAAALDPEAAMKSISMGSAQIMGFNHKLVGFPTVQAMFDAYSTSEPAQIRGFFDFVKNTGLEEAARKGDWTTFARGYNGKGQRGYDDKMQAAYKQYVAKGFAGLA